MLTVVFFYDLAAEYFEFGYFDIALSALTLGWAAGRAPGLQKLISEVLAWFIGAWCK